MLLHVSSLEAFDLLWALQTLPRGPLLPRFDLGYFFLKTYNNNLWVNKGSLEVKKYKRKVVSSNQNQIILFIGFQLNNNIRRGLIITLTNYDNNENKLMIDYQNKIKTG